MERPNAIKRAYEASFESDSDEEYVIRRPRWIRERANDFDNLDEVDFITRYRLSKRTALSVLEIIEDELEFSTNKNCSVAPINQLLCALRFYGTGCFQSVSGDLSGISTSTAHRIVHRVSCALAGKHAKFLVFPQTEDEIKRTQMKFYDIARFPRVIGAIDCTHIRLGKCPDSAIGEIFRNRKSYFSLNVQAVCNADLEITNSVVRWPGSTHDSHIFNNSRLKRMFDEGKYGNSVLVGDSGYACKKYMMTPLDECNTQAEHLYNESQIRTRNPVERMFGVWKRRFPAMALGMRLSLQNVFPVITASAILLNIALQNREVLPPDDEELILPAPWELLIGEGNIGVPNARIGGPHQNINFKARQSLIANYFQRLAQLAAAH